MSADVMENRPRSGWDWDDARIELAAWRVARFITTNCCCSALRVLT
jgi:hypothetical protein